MPQRLLTFALLSLAAAAGSRDASALGFGRAQPSATLGYPLDFSVTLRLDSGEVLLPSCVSAEVTVGDVQLSRAAVGASLENTGAAPTIRVRTSAPVDEPVVSVLVTAGCEAKVSRRFTLLADPPGMASAAPPVADADAPVAVSAPVSSPVSEPVSLATREGPVRPEPGPRNNAPAQPAASAVRVGAAPGAPGARAKRTVKLSKAETKPSKAAKAARVRAPQLAVSAPRLRLEEPTFAAANASALAASAAEREAVLMSAQLAASAAQAAAAAASSRVAALEAGMEAVKRDAQANREQMQRLGQALAEADSRGRWTPWLAAALLLLAGSTGWLWTRLRAARKEQSQSWWNAQSGLAEAAPAAPADASDVSAPAAPDEAAETAAAMAAVPTPDTGPEPLTQRTSPLPQTAVLREAPVRDVTIEELLDLEQQAEFFIVLGQDESAIDLLVSHLRSNGGTSPLPYLKLMDIYRRRGEEAAYERTRDRFNHRFNALAPAWATDVRHGRTLVDYPDVMAQLEHNWPRSVDAMADLETLLFRTDAQEMFELPAYRDVLFLYSLARDLLEQGDRHAARIDVMLPLGVSPQFSPTSARPYLTDGPRDGPSANGNVDVLIEDAATAPVDLDLSDATPARATSQFGFFESAPAKASTPGA